MLGGIDCVASFITVIKLSESNLDCSFQSFFAYFASGDHITRMYLPGVFICLFVFSLLGCTYILHVAAVFDRDRTAMRLDFSVRVNFPYM